MSQSSQSILDHIAEMLRFISNAQSFWFTLDTSYNHGCHLANRFRLEPNDYEVLLVVAGLVHYTRFGFAMKPMAWSKFLGGHRFASDNCEIELDIKKIDLDAYFNGTPPSRLKRKKFYVIRIGNKTERIQKYMRALLAELIDLLSTNYELNVIDSSNNTLSFVRVPKTSSDRSFQNTKEWLDVAIKIAASKHKTTYEAAYRIANHLCRFVAIVVVVVVVAPSSSSSSSPVAIAIAVVSRRDP